MSETGGETANNKWYMCIDKGMPCITKWLAVQLQLVVLCRGLPLSQCHGRAYISV